MTSTAGARGASGTARGLCPSVHAPFLELDGALIRIRLPGGIVTAEAAHAVAAAVAGVGGGAIELTNRANLQLRGIPPESVPRVRDALVATGLALAEPDADERRNVLASPTAGVDAAELLDTTSLVEAIAERLASRAASGLSPKFGVLVDGGGAVHVRDRVHDIALGAVQLHDGTVHYEVRLGEALCTARRPSEPVWVVAEERALDAVDALIEVCRPFGRARALLDTCGTTHARDAIASRARGALTWVSPASVVVTDAVSESPIGVRPQREPGYVSVGAAVMLGRLGAEQLADVAEASNAAGDASLRISPWRHVVLTNVATRDAAVVVARLEQIGLVTDPDHPANVVVACTGSRGCAAGLVDAPADARVLIDLLAERPVEARPRSVHVSGCEKGCASPSQAAVTIVGGPAPETYTFYCGSSDDSRFGTAVQSGLDARTAVEQVVVAGEQRAR